MRIALLQKPSGNTDKDSMLKACVRYFQKKNVFLSYFERSTLKRNLNYCCFIFLSFHKHLFPLELPRAAPFLKLLVLKNDGVCNQGIVT